MFRFLTPDGNRLPGISETDSITYRIEALRCYLEHNLTEDVFLKAYKYIQVSTNLFTLLSSDLGV
jgi:hypothetical protein